MLHKSAVLLGLLLLALLALPAGAQQGGTAPTELRMMTFNIWVGGELVDFGKVVEAIQLAGADVVGLQEATGNTRRLAQALGWQHVSERMQIISRYPLIDPPGADGQYIFVQINPGEVVALMNVHLPSDPYGPYAVRDGATLDEVLQLERDTRLPAIEPVLARVPELLDAGIPVLLTGDFNAPSHRDWTAAVTAANPQRLYPVAWPVSLAVEAAGFVDTYRAVHPDPVANPGNTWTYGYPYPRLLEDEMIDRIDLVFAAGAVEVLDSQIVGETGGPDVGVGVLPFPSDHRGVVSTLRLTPGVPPVFVAAAARRVEAGERVVVHYHAPNGEFDGDRIAIVPAGGGSAATLMWLPPYEASFFGSVTFGTGALTPGGYDAVLFDAGDNELSRSPFWVVERGAVPAVTTDAPAYAPGAAITVRWHNAPAMRWDWVGIYAAGDPDVYNNYWAYAYTGASVNGSVVFDASLVGEDMLPPGDYEVRLLLDDGYSVLASAAFTVSE